MDYHIITKYVQKLNHFGGLSLPQLCPFHGVDCSHLSPLALSGKFPPSSPLLPAPGSSIPYPTPVFPPWEVLFDLAPSFLNHPDIFGWFLVSISPLLLSFSSPSLFFFAFSASRSFRSLFFYSRFARLVAFLIRFWAPLSFFIGPRCPWGPIYGSGCLSLTNQVPQQLGNLITH